jgi:hypothetical protein
MPAAVVVEEPIPDRCPEGCGKLNLGSGPHAEFLNPLKLFGRIVPTVVVTKTMSRKVVLQQMLTTAAVR